MATWSLRAIKKFWSKVRVGDPTVCWPWTGACDVSGYGIAGQGEKAHRAAYKLLIGEPPPKHELHHVCENKRCANPAHLKPLTKRAHARVNHPPGCCLQGHAMSPGNTIVSPQGYESCRICKLARVQRWRQRQREKKPRRPKYKLTPADVREIRRLHDDEGVHVRDLTGRFNVGTTCVRSVVRRKSWRHVT
jgi:hypothetical protein